MSQKQSVRFLHLRNCDAKGHILEKGGATIAYIVDERDAEPRIHVSVAQCRKPDLTLSGRIDPGDLFCYRHGRAIAAGRLARSGPMQTITLEHPINEHLMKWFADFAGIKSDARRDNKGRWISQFINAYEDEPI